MRNLFKIKRNWKSFNRRTTNLLLLVCLCTATDVAYSAPKTILVLGDSLSAEYGLARGSGWVALLQERLHDKHIEAKVVNASISGETTSGAASRIDALLGTEHPNIVVVELGGNDGLRGLPLPATEQNFRNIIKASKKAHAKVLLIGMQIPPNYGHSYTEQFRTMYGAIASEEQVSLAPFLLQGIAEHTELFQPDHIHVIAAAHPKILENVWPTLLPLILAK